MNNTVKCVPVNAILDCESELEKAYRTVREHEQKMRNAHKIRKSIKLSLAELDDLLDPQQFATLCWNLAMKKERESEYATKDTETLKAKLLQECDTLRSRRAYLDRGNRRSASADRLGNLISFLGDILCQLNDTDLA